MSPVELIQKADVLGNGRVVFQPEPDGGFVPSDEIMLSWLVGDGLAAAEWNTNPFSASSMA
jgi:hypothetical protein